MKPILYRQAVRRVANHAPAEIYRKIAKDHIRMANALKKIEKKAVNYGLSAGFTGTIWTIAKRALGEA